jgi:hypothetical protein
MKDVVGGEQAVFIFSAETLAILGASEGAVLARRAEEGGISGHHN